MDVDIDKVSPEQFKGILDGIFKIGFDILDQFFIPIIIIGFTIGSGIYLVGSVLKSATVKKVGIGIIFGIIGGALLYIFSPLLAGLFKYLRTYVRSSI